MDFCRDKHLVFFRGFDHHAIAYLGGFSRFRGSLGLEACLLVDLDRDGSPFWCPDFNMLLIDGGNRAENMLAGSMSKGHGRDEQQCDCKNDAVKHGESGLLCAKG